MRLYLDVCSLCRPYDDLTIDRNRLEADAVLAILGRVEVEEHQLVSSEIIERELGACPDVGKSELVRQWLLLAKQRVTVAAEHAARARELQAMGFRKLDAFHVACAEATRCAMLLTTDDKFIRRASGAQASLLVRIQNPLQFILEVDQ